jgi:molybdopterin converting factor small subunit
VPHTLTVRLFGEFRNLIPEAEISLIVDKNASLSEVKAQLALYFRDRGLVEKNLVEVSALADEDSIFQGSDNLAGRTWLALLPPVSGG